MSVAELVEKAATLSDEEKAALICGIVGDMKARGLKTVVSKIEEEFDVKAASPGIDPSLLTGMVPDGSGAETAEAEPTEFDVVLTAVGEAKIKVIKEVRSITGLGLKEAKGLVDSIPKPVKEKINKEEAESIKGKLEEVGALAEIKPAG